MDTKFLLDTMRHVGLRTVIVDENTDFSKLSEEIMEPFDKDKHDKHGRPWAKLSELKASDKVELDGGFTCTPAGTALVQGDQVGLFFSCQEGNHYISGQADDGEHCIGIYGPIRSLSTQPMTLNERLRNPSRIDGGQLNEIHVTATMEEAAIEIAKLVDALINIERATWVEGQDYRAMLMQCRKIAARAT